MTYCCTLIRDMSFRVCLLGRLVHRGVIVAQESTWKRLRQPTSTLPRSESQLPSPPTDCCECGCYNCVWIGYAESLAKTYQDSRKASQEVLNQIEDPSLKAFIQLELKERIK